MTTTETWPTATAFPSPDPLPDAVKTNDSDAEVLCFGDFYPETDQEGFHGRDYRASNVQFNACEFRFRGSAVRWFGSKNRDHGFADVYLNGVLQKTVDSYHATWISNVVLFEKTGLDAGPVHTLRIVVRKKRIPGATDCYQDVDCFEAAQPVNYVAEITQAMQAEYRRSATTRSRTPGPTHGSQCPTSPTRRTRVYRCRPECSTKPCSGTSTT